ncbi:DUF1552 domain-containing protein [Blastopirellula sp. JC732]|uniref:DUF1552 domain-containing protein n=1 Tax=Blastopirellula sediminis TaxID=2894196 RepID=A0A9X1SF91_9BACT|nr:DUF1552 domain-containing protein [Blastopirellula sediminis]MCC9608323.1 DUF1552 domain-containing protein [Blastopirellula sediminis]MCC9628900.1 DUF1552 domain-containing protein [Blastopirellula sediminis]
MKSINRRRFLQASGVAIGLPLLEGQRVRGAEANNRPGQEGDIRRMLSICSPLGYYGPYFFPEGEGADYKASPYLEPLQPLRDKFTVISGLNHPDVNGGHSAEKSFLTGAAHPGRPGFQNTISVDQYAAEFIGKATRFSSLSLGLNGTSMSWTRAGVAIPTESRPSKLFAKLFLAGTAAERATQLQRVQNGQSIMDLVLDQTKSVARDLGKHDGQTLDQYLSSIRDLEEGLRSAEEWIEKPKPTVDRKPPQDVADRSDLTARMQLMYDMIFLAFQTDSTRLITLSGAGDNGVVSLDGVEDGWHNLSHHGRDEDKIKMLAIIEREEMRLFAELMQKLNDVQEGDHTLLDQTSIVLGSNLGNASSHDNSNLPIIAAGGRFQHGRHLAFDPNSPPPLCNLFVSQLQHLNIEVDRFSTGSGTLTGLAPLRG